MKEWEYAALVPAGSSDSWSLNQKSGSYNILIEIELNDPLEDVGSEWKKVGEGVYRLEVGKISWSGFNDFIQVSEEIDEAVATGQESVEKILGESIVSRAELIEEGERPESIYTKTDLLTLLNTAGEDGWELNGDITLQNGENEGSEMKLLLMRRDIT
ncbi:MAG: hypothetical protein CMB77_01000 [Euryarchaeota archaeon]|nr:hypothetical protein [Euryarchaeota archaeon]|tara:strand:- start:192 stop:665 length:474 start_codon:yes stop_codon:yes gene_type:complete